MIKINNIVVLITASLIALFLFYLSFRGGNSAAYLLPKTYSVILASIVIILIFFHIRKKNNFYKELDFSHYNIYYFIYFVWRRFGILFFNNFNFLFYYHLLYS
jgi:hypothetical protein